MNRASSALSALVMLVAQIAPASASPVPVEAMATLNWSGYALAGSAFTGVTGTFNVPAPLESAPCGAETLVWVGVDGLDNHDLLQAGVAESTFVVPSSPRPPEASAGTFLCTGQVQVLAWWEDLPSEQVRVDLSVKVGDKVSVSIFKMSPGWPGRARPHGQAELPFGPALCRAPDFGGMGGRGTTGHGPRH